MEEYIQYAKEELCSLKESGKSIKTSDVRKVSGKVYRMLKAESFHKKLDICESLLQQKSWAMGVIAYDIAFRERKHYTLDTFDRFEHWLVEYVRGWGDCDDFCTHAFGALLAEHNELFPRVLGWCKRPEFWVRRAAAVILIYPMNKDLISGLDPFKVSDALMGDDEDLVQKGYGWMLKVYGITHPERLVEYLKANVERMPRVAFRYALEKLDKDTRKELMKL